MSNRRQQMRCSYIMIQLNCSTYQFWGRYDAREDNNNNGKKSVDNPLGIFRRREQWNGFALRKKKQKEVAKLNSLRSHRHASP